MGGKSKAPTIGYRYLLGMHMVLCHGPIDSITRLEVDGKTAWSGSNTGGRMEVSADNLFGGDRREGGVSGAIDIAMGSHTQGRNDYLQARLGNDIPAYRGVVSAILRQVYVGLNPYLKRWAFWAQRIHVRGNGQAQWYNAKAAIGTDMNPAHIIRECLTDAQWGMGYPENVIDDAAFTAAADQLHSEGFGLSLLWDKSMQIDDFLGTILKHIDGSLYVHRVTGRFMLKLARGDYNVDDLLVLDENSIERVSDFKRNTIDEMSNSVTVVFWDGTTGKDNSVTVQDIALTAQQGATVGTTMQYPGITKSELASRVASRDLAALSTPFASATIYATRKAAELNIGDVFVLNWARFGIVRTVMRVTNVELGSLGNNLVKLTAVEDIFSLSDAMYAPPPSEWQDPVNAPQPCPQHIVMEAPYWEIAQRVGDTEAAALDATAGFVVATGTRPSDDAINAKLIVAPQGGSFEEAAAADFCPMAVLTAEVAPNATTLPIAGGVDMDIVRTGAYALLGQEIVRIDSIAPSEITVGRGCLDTVPAQHLAGVHLYFADDVFASDNTEYALNEDIHIKLLPATGVGILAADSAPVQTVRIAGRQARPYPPAKLRINNHAYPAAVQGSSDMVITWAHRNRLQQTATIIDTEAASITPEAGTTYALELRKPDNTLIASASNISGDTHTFTVSDIGTHYGDMRILLWAVRDGLDSHQTHDWTVTRTGYGMTYGTYYGGI